MDILLIGCSGFVSGTVARAAVAAGHRVWGVARGEKPLPRGIMPVRADRRDRAGFAAAIDATGKNFDLVVDGIGYAPEDARQDIEVFRERAAQLVFISTDFVFDPARRTFPQPEEGHFLHDALSYGGKKRLCELEFIHGDCGAMAWTILRPCHIYGPGSLLGCLPLHGRDATLLDRMQSGETLKLVGGGHFLQQPIRAADLAALILSCAGNPHCRNEIYQAAGPDIVESAEYYRIIAEVLDTPLAINEVPVDAYKALHPESAPFLCHRIYDLGKLRAHGLAVPSTPLRDGLREHVESLRQAA